MNRIESLKMAATPEKVWDMVVVGGGATGLGCAVDAAARGFSVLLLEAEDFAKSTSSKSTKLVHGGVRYLQQGDVLLVLEALRERGRMKRNASHLVKDQSFVMPVYTYWDKFLYFCGLTLYDMLSLGFGYGRSRTISAKGVSKRLPAVKRQGLKGGIIYHDGQFDDSRMAVNLAQTVSDKGGAVINYAKVKNILHNSEGDVCGVEMEDTLGGESYQIKAKSVINATGVHIDQIIRMDCPNSAKMVRPSQGTHLVIDQKFLSNSEALMIPKTTDGRVLFAIPWHNRVVVGTTDILKDEISSEPTPADDEIDFILANAAQYMDPAPTRSDILAVFCGQRPLAAPKDETKKTKEMSRSHKIIVSKNKLVTITGGKWTAYRLMAEDTIDRAIKVCGLSDLKCRTKSMKIHGWAPLGNLNDPRYVYGSDVKGIEELTKECAEYNNRISEAYQYTIAEVVWAVREEMACTVEDVLARRVRLLYIDAKAAVDASPVVAAVMAKELGKDEKWQADQIESFTKVAQNYIAI